MQVDCVRSEALLPDREIQILRKIFSNNHITFAPSVFIMCVYIKEDYLHLVKLLTTHICKTTKLSKTSTNEKWAVGEVTRTKARDLVQKVMSQCIVYSASSNLQLGLNEC